MTTRRKRSPMHPAEQGREPEGAGGSRMHGSGGSVAPVRLPQTEDSSPESEREALEIEERLRYLGYID